MKKPTILTIFLTTLSIQSFGQTNRINHYSHSGSTRTLDIFKSNDNMGLNCGSISNKEYQPDTISHKTFLDSTKMDTTKNKVCKPINTSPEKPRRGLSLEPTFKVQDVLNKF